MAQVMSFSPTLYGLKNPMNKPSDFLTGYSIRACYADTDAAGVIHHARLLEFFERSRTEWLERINAGPQAMEDLNLLLIIREVTLKFHKPGRLNDRLGFTHRISKVGNSQFALEQAVFLIPSGETQEPDPEQCLASATFHIVCISIDKMKSHPLPSSIISAAR